MIDKIVKYGIYFALFMPLVFTSRTMFPWHFGKTALFQVLVEVLIVLGVGSYLFKRVFEKKGGKSECARFNVLDWVFLAFLCSQLLAAFFGVNFEKSFWGSQQRMQGVFTWLHFGAYYYLLRVYIDSKKEWFRLVEITVGVAFVSSLIALFGGDVFLFKGVVSSGGRVSGLLGNPIFLAGYLVIPLFLSVVLYKNERKYPYWYLALTGFILIAFLLSQTRGAYIGLVVGVFSGVIFYLKYGFSVQLKQVLLNLSLLLVILLSGVYLVNEKTSYLKDSFPRISHLVSVNASETTGSTRILAWRTAIDGWNDRVLFGWGPENYGDLFDNNYNLAFLDYGFGETVWDKPHNNLVEVLSESGFVGLAVYLLLLFVLVFYLFRMVVGARGESDRIVLALLVSAVVSFVGQNFFSFFTSDSLLMFVFLLALVASFKVVELNESREDGVVELVGWRGYLLNSGALIVLVLCVFGMFVSVSIYKSSVAMADARDWAEVGSMRKWQENARRAIDFKTPFDWEQSVFIIRDLSLMDNAGKLDKRALVDISGSVIGILEREVERNEQSYLLRFWLSQLYSMMGEYVDSIYFIRSNDLLIEAGEISIDRQQVPLHLSKNYMLIGDNEKSIDVLREFVLVDGERPQSHWFLGVALVGNDEIEEGVLELERGFEFGKNNPNNVLYLIEKYVKLDEIGKIIPLYEQLIIDYPLNAQYYARLAATYAALEDEVNMTEYLNKAVEIDPGLKNEAELFVEEYMSR